MAYKFEECEFCVHRAHGEFCDECEDGDCFEPFQQRKRRAPPIEQQGCMPTVQAISFNPTSYKGTYD